MQPPPGHVIIVGSGVYGASAALELRGRGWSVTVVDPGPLPHEAASSTDISKVVRMDYGEDAFYTELAELALDGWDRWNADWPRPLYHESGFLILARGRIAPGGFEYESRRVLAERGWVCEPVGAKRLAESYPAWSGETFTEGYFNPRGGWVESGEVVRRLVELARAAGVTFLAGVAQRIVSEGSRVSGVALVDGTTAHADCVIVCAGAWTPALLPWLSDRLWSVGQPVLHFGVEDPDAWRGRRFPAWAADITGSGWYGFPALDDGRLKVGHHGPGTRIAPGKRGEVSNTHVERTRRFFAEALPSLSAAPVVGQRVCMYCDTFDGDFLIDRDPDREGLVVAAGGNGHAFKFAPLLGGIIADALEGRPDRRRERFGWRIAGGRRFEAARFIGD